MIRSTRRAGPQYPPPLTFRAPEAPFGSGVATFLSQWRIADGFPVDPEGVSVESTLHLARSKTPIPYCTSLGSVALIVRGAPDASSENRAVRLRALTCGLHYADSERRAMALEWVADVGKELPELRTIPPDLWARVHDRVDCPHYRFTTMANVVNWNPSLSGSCDVNNVRRGYAAIGERKSKRMLKACFTASRRVTPGGCGMSKNPYDVSGVDGTGTSGIRRDRPLKPLSVVIACASKCLKRNGIARKTCWRLSQRITPGHAYVTTKSLQN
jgi:hypothetical protein